jgi:hypothetical protein
MKISRTAKRALVAIGFATLFVALVALVVVAVPIRYRLGIWQKLPVLYHALLPHLSAFFAAAFGACFGSLSAFYLGRVQQRSDRCEKRHAALITTQYALMSQWDIIEAIRVQHLEDRRDDPNRFSKLKLYWFPMAPSVVPFADLTFILETKEPNLLHQIHIAEQNYRACAQALQMRNQELQKFYDNPRVSHHVLDFETGAGVTAASDLDQLFLRQATDGLYTAVDRALPRLVAAIENVGQLITSMFPGKTALKMTPVEQR